MITVITGPMFSGKTTELIRRIRCAEIARQRTLVLKPTTDTRSGLEVVSHSGLRWAASLAEVASPGRLPRDLDVLGVDEAQFLGEAWVHAIDAMANAGKEVVLACLNQDFKGEPFGIADRLLAMADNVIHLKAVCLACGAKDAATKTFRISGGEGQVEIGGAEKYQALCRRCWVAKSALAGARAAGGVMAVAG
jgi:thymidine kinase